VALHWKILISIFLACLAGLATGPDDQLLGINFYYTYDFIGDIFLNALRMLIVPLITSSIILGITQLGTSKALGRLGAKTITYYMFSSLIAITIGLMAVNLVQPGIISGEPVAQKLGLIEDVESTLKRVEGRGMHDIINVFKRMIPDNIVDAAAKGNMLGLIFFSILFGTFMSRIQEDLKTTLTNFWKGVFETMMLITIWIMTYIAPIGVFGLVAKTVSDTGFAGFQPILAFLLTVTFALCLHMFVVLPLMLRFIAKVHPIRHFRAMTPALLTAFSTSSSSATLPLTMECVEKEANVSNQTTSFVLPLGATINMDGTALYECVAAMFIAQAYGLDLTIGVQFTVVLLALITSIGVAGVPAASLVAIIIIMGAIGLPPEGIGLIMVTDRILDMFRTAVNIFSDSCGAVIIAKTEGETNLLPDRSQS